LRLVGAFVQIAGGAQRLVVAGVVGAAAAGTIARQTRRGVRLDKPNSRVQIDGIVALAMAYSRAAEPVPEVKLLGWL
jgi:hypothetical protein